MMALLGTFWVIIGLAMIFHMRTLTSDLKRWCSRMEDTWQVRTHNTVPLSEEDIVSCTSMEDVVVESKPTMPEATAV